MEENKLYEAPMIEVIEVAVERGYASSGNDPHGINACGDDSDDTMW